MRRLSIDNRLFFYVLVLMLTLGISSVAQAADQSPNVYLQAINGDTEVGFIGGAYLDTCNDAQRRGDDPNTKGYLCFKQGNSGIINMHMITNGNCEEEAGANWHITEVIIGGEGSKTEPTTWGELSKGAASDLGVPDALTGVVDLTPDSGQVVHFDNNNVHEIIFWYKITAVCTRGEQTFGVPIYSDPRGRNGGTD